MIKLVVASLAAVVLTLTPSIAMAAKDDKDKNKDNNGNPNISCPAGSELLDKYELKGNSYKAQDTSGKTVTVTGDSTGGTFKVEDTSKQVTFVIVKGSTDTKTDAYPLGVSEGSFNDDGLENNPGNTPGISNVQFCGRDKPGMGGGGTTPTPDSPVTPSNPVQPQTTQQPSQATPQVQVPVGGVAAGSGSSGIVASSVLGLIGSAALLSYGAFRVRAARS